MKKYRIILAGKNNSIIDDFLMHTTDDFEPLSSSLNFTDMETHLDIAKPDIFIYCPAADTKGDVSKIVELKRKLSRYGTVFGIIGDPADCDSFNKSTTHMQDFSIEKPVTIEQIKVKILDFMREYEQLRAASAVEEEVPAEPPKVERRKHILVIDDDPSMLKLIKEHLHDKYDVATALNGKIAYRFLDQKSTDLILLDYEMPGENGAAVLANLRARPNLSNLPVLFLTGITDRSMVVEALKQKPQDYLIKPIDKDKLIGTVEKYLG